jgi:hypothetical protein
MAFACEDVVNVLRAREDEAAGPATFKNVIDGMAAADFPAPAGRWFAIFCFFSEEPQLIANCRIIVEHEKGELIAQKALRDLTFTPENPISRNVVSFQGLLWPYPGGYLVKFVASSDDLLAYFPIWVRHEPAAAQEEVQA